jgi:hypothetical protein
VTAIQPVYWRVGRLYRKHSFRYCSVGCFHCIAPSDFHLFGLLKHHLSAEYFPDDEAVEREVIAWFRQQLKEFYAADFQGFVKRWDKCLNVQGDYVEK